MIGVLPVGALLEVLCNAFQSGSACVALLEQPNKVITCVTLANTCTTCTSAALSMTSAPLQPSNVPACLHNDLYSILRRIRCL